MILIADMPIRKKKRKEGKFIVFYVKEFPNLHFNPSPLIIMWTCNAWKQSPSRIVGHNSTNPTMEMNLSIEYTSECANSDEKE